ncbi:hypothetical protein C7S16_0397 [Burkholderia thailandensis]|uniref:Uncharacterized protein n=1 Tax=Burkholderia thailandensis TaxID=57975 RepID=A0AAW9CSV8_BURTH|nr:hypothetical protein [Burkholderia thailandensis]
MAYRLRFDLLGLFPGSRRETRRLYRESRPTGILTQKPNVESPMPARAAGWHRRGAGIAFRDRTAAIPR